MFPGQTLNQSQLKSISTLSVCKSVITPGHLILKKFIFCSEMVMKHKTHDDQSNVQRPSKVEIPAAAVPDCLASIFNRISNNISVKVHNIILKYIVEDIAFSVKIQQLSFDSADKDWNAAFIDLTDVLLKKIINICGLTISLEYPLCEEYDVLSRCDLQARILRKYNDSSVVTRIDIFTELIELNIPFRDCTYVLNTMKTIPDPLKCSSTNASAEKNAIDSMAALNLDESEKRNYCHIGMYINKFIATLKVGEQICTCVNEEKMKSQQILKVSVVGIYGDAFWLKNLGFNLKAGISNNDVTAYRLCACGEKHDHSSIVTPLQMPAVEHCAFLDDSLMDPMCPENNGEFRSYDQLWETRNVKTAAAELRRRTPFAAMAGAFNFFRFDEYTVPHFEFGRFVTVSHVHSNLAKNFVVGFKYDDQARTYKFDYNFSVAYCMQNIDLGLLDCIRALLGQ